jgi:hypothetical protein
MSSLQNRRLCLPYQCAEPKYKALVLRKISIHYVTFSLLIKEVGGWSDQKEGFKGQLFMEKDVKVMS